MKKKLLYWVPNVLLVAFMAGSGIYYFFDIPAMTQAFVELGYPPYTLYFNATAKILGGIAILFPVPGFLKEWAYVGYLYIMLLAMQALFVMMPGFPWPMLGFVALWGFSYWQYRVAIGR